MDPAYLASFGALEDRHWWFRARREIIADQLQLSGAWRDGDFLDVGAGTGGLLRYVAASVPGIRCRGVEPDAGARLHCADLGAEVVEGGADRLPIDSESQDTATALDVLEHVDDDARAARELARVLRPGGVAVVTVPAYRWLWGPHDEINGHKRRYVRRDLERVIAGAGLVIERSTYFNHFLLPVAIAERTAARISGRHAEAEKLPWAPLNALLYGVFRTERPLLRRFRLPWGLSVLVVARKPDNAAARAAASPLGGGGVGSPKEESS